MKILLVEDSKAIASLEVQAVRHIFNEALQVVRALDGQTAVEKFKEETVDLILLDWHLPEKSGIEVLKEIRAMDAQVPIIMITSETALHSINAAVKAGVSDYIIKPFNIQVLEEKIGRHLHITKT
ncbi:response regulator transcription factor [Piscirickettsia litoralis]|uniref:Response regulatory domain-containing protein n=1 Tax=Piscirickettsia litoralis TaxID=1891921 RepID=A0ABX3A7H5_9GAMM|nr:response regulator [Piscirickettsia litoralis]ODN42044.1 hypothetical protein BGC07_02580 [Piscirickettsia litoralis]